MDATAVAVTTGQAGRRASRWPRRVLLAALALLAAGLAAVLALVYLVHAVPLPADLDQSPTVVRYADGTLLGTLQPRHQREDVGLEELPDHLVHAVLAAEDAGFYDHPGISLSGVLRAAVVNLARGEVRQGGSTISQQYVKNAVLGDHSRSALRKLREAALALQLERRYSKDEILERYLNAIYLGRGAYGVQAASQAYFGKPAHELRQAEAVLLAAMIPAPSVTDPLDHPDRARARYGHVVDRLAAEGRVGPAQAEQLRAAGPPPVIAQAQMSFSDAPFFLRMVAAELASVLDTERVYAGLDVTTTLDRRLQGIAEDSYAAHFPAPSGPTGALVALWPHSGGIATLVGGRDYASDQVNLATSARQPGSTFKTFALAAWVEAGNSPDRSFAAPATYVMAGADGGRDYPVANYGHAAYGELSLRRATWRSVNTVYAQVAEQVGFDAVAGAAERAGIDQGVQPFASLVLGTEEVTPLELAEAYNTFAAQGVHREPFTVAVIRRDGEVVFRRRPFAERVFSSDVTAVVTDVLRGVIASGTGHAAASAVAAAGKTGTTNDHGDAWFAGYTPGLTAVVWMGNRDDRARMPGDPTGGDLPAQLWGDFVGRAHREVLAAAVDFPPPPSSLP